MDHKRPVLPSPLEAKVFAKVSQVPSNAMYSLIGSAELNGSIQRPICAMSWPASGLPHRRIP